MSDAVEHRQRRVHALGRLTHHAVAELTGLRLTGSPYRDGEAFQRSERVRDVALYRGAELSDHDRDLFIHNAADRLTPTIARERGEDFSLIGTAQTADVAQFARYVRYREWYNADLVSDSTTAHVYVGRALYLTYRDAITRVLNWIDADEAS